MCRDGEESVGLVVCVAVPSASGHGVAQSPTFDGAPFILSALPSSIGTVRHGSHRPRLALHRGYRESGN